MAVLTVRHTTIYRYRVPVGLGEHRMMFRPRDSHDLRLIRSDLRITPHPVALRWLHDTCDNSVAIATFDGTTSELRFESTVTLEHLGYSAPEYPLEAHARTYPFRYADEDVPTLAPALARRQPAETVSNWALQFLDAAETTNTMEILRAMTRHIGEQFVYVRRLEKGVRSPEETLDTRRGSCRDLAMLMIDAFRSLGVAARFASGYLFMPDASGSASGDATHAWVQTYLPGAGWIDLDPTHSIIGNRHLIRVAVACDPLQVLPLWGTF